MDRQLLITASIMLALCFAQPIAAESFVHSLFKPFFACDGTKSHNNGPDWLCFPDTPETTTVTDATAKAPTQTPTTQNTANAAPIIAVTTIAATTTHKLSQNASIAQNSQEALNLNKKLYTMQLVATKTLQDLTVFRKKHHYSEGYVLTTKNARGTLWYILLHDIYTNRKDALNDIQTLPASLQKNQPWVRSIKGLQKTIYVEPKKAS